MRTRRPINNEIAAHRKRTYQLVVDLDVRLAETGEKARVANEEDARHPGVELPVLWLEDDRSRVARGQKNGDTQEQDKIRDARGNAATISAVPKRRFQPCFHTGP